MSTCVPPAGQSENEHFPGLNASSNHISLPSSVVPGNARKCAHIDFEQHASFTRASPPPSPLQPYQCRPKIYIFYLMMMTDIHPKCIAAKQIATIQLVGQCNSQALIMRDVKCEHLKIIFLHSSIWVAASGAEAEGGTGYQMVEATCHQR